jgi:Domain of unknown function (DUF1772)
MANTKPFSDNATNLIAFVTVVILGLSAGAMLTESVVFVQFWQTLSPTDFLKWFAEHEPLLGKFSGSLQTLSAVLILITTVLFWVKGNRGKYFTTVSSLLVIAVILIFFAYFQQANQNIVTASVPLDDVKAQLSNWAFYQWIRTFLGIGAFVFAIGATLKN